MNHDTKIQLAALAVLSGCLAGSGVLAVDLSSQQARYKLVYTADANEGQPPQVALGIAMGAFRGVFVNWLWMRANDLKEEGRFHESVELAKAITVLQPRFPRAWTFHAWNLAYNISVTTQTAPERWNWVRQGIDLLRGPGIRFNPSDLHIHKELAWIFLHKIQGITDDANQYYKKMLAKEWYVVLGPPPPYDVKVRTKKAAIDRAISWLRPIADAPETLEGLYAGPDGETARALVNAIVTNGLRPELDYDTLAQYEVDRASVRSGRRKALEAANPLGPKSLAFRALVEDPAYAKAWPRLLAFIRAKLIREKYFMDINVMIRFTEKYGPLDWRHAASHALYWSARGVEAALPRAERQNEKDFDFVNTDRIVIQSVQELYRSGAIYMDYLDLELDPRGQGYYVSLVDPFFVDSYGDIIEELRQRSKVDKLFERGYSYYSAGHENFMKDAIRYFYRLGDMASAQKYYTQLRNYAGMNLNDPDRDADLSVPLSEFVVKELWDRQTSPYVAVSEVTGAIQGAIVALINQDPDRFGSQMDYARDFFAYFKAKQERDSAITADARMGVFSEKFAYIAGVTFVRQIMTLPFEQAETAYNQAPDWLRQYAYDGLKAGWADVLKNEESVGGRKFETVFPEPLGMPAFREQMARDLEERKARAARLDNNLK